MAKLPWYFKQVGKPKSKKGKIVYTFKIHWLYVWYICLKTLLKTRFELTERKSKLKIKP